MNERNLYRAFRISVLLKGAHALIECIGGVLIAVIDTGTITRLVDAMTQDELREDANDFIATHLQTLAHDFTVSTQHFYAWYLLSHGAVKLLLVAGLLRNKLWSYPASIVTLWLFIAYQIYRYTYTHSIGLIALTIFDVVVVGLIWHEYRVVLRLRKARTTR